MIPTVNFCGTDISRLIVGGNTVSGTSHFSHEMDVAMEDYFTTEKIKDMLFRCMEEGINTFQFRSDKHILRLIREFRQQGGHMNWIAQSAPELPYEANVSQMASYKPALMYHHGCVTDTLFKNGEHDELTRRLDLIRRTGVPVGLCTHMPEVVHYAEEHKWDVDFYMCCVYNISVPEREKQSRMDGNEDALFVEADIPVMYETIRSVDKPCLAFKILGAMRRCMSQDTVQAAFDEAFASIKPSDCVVVGMFPQDLDQVSLNSAYVRNAIMRAER